MPILDEDTVIGVSIIAPPGFLVDLSKTNIQGDTCKCIFIQEIKSVSGGGHKTP